MQRLSTAIAPVNCAIRDRMWVLVVDFPLRPGDIEFLAVEPVQHQQAARRRVLRLLGGPQREVFRRKVPAEVSRQLLCRRL